MDLTGFGSSIILILRGGILMSVGDFPESLSQAILVVGIMLVGRLGVCTHAPLFFSIHELSHLRVDACVCLLDLCRRRAVSLRELFFECHIGNFYRSYGGLTIRWNNLHVKISLETQEIIVSRRLAAAAKPARWSGPCPRPRAGRYRLDMYIYIYIYIYMHMYVYIYI